MTIALATIRGDLFDQVKTASAGSAIRALLGPALAGGDGADGVLTAEAFKRAAEGRTLPAEPFLVWRALPISGETDEMRGVTGFWWVYDAPRQGYARIRAILDLFPAAYPKRGMAYGRLSVGPIGQETEAPEVGGRLVCTTQVRYTRRG